MACSIISAQVCTCVYLCVCVNERERLWMCRGCWQGGDIWNLRIRFVFLQKQHGDDLCFIFKLCVSYPPSLLSNGCCLTFVFNHLSGMPTLTPTEKTHPTCDYRYRHRDGMQATGIVFFLCESKYDISGTFSERCCIILSESTRNYTHVVVAYCTGCVVSQRSAVWVTRSDKKSLCEAVPKQKTEVSVQKASGWNLLTLVLRMWPFR